MILSVDFNSSCCPFIQKNFRQLIKMGKMTHTTRITKFRRELKAENKRKTGVIHKEVRQQKCQYKLWIDL